MKSLEAVSEEGRGVVVLIRDLAPAIDFGAGSNDTAQAEADTRRRRERRQVEIGVGSQILLDLGVRDMMLLTNSPAHVYVGLEAFGLRIVGTRRIL